MALFDACRLPLCDAEHISLWIHMDLAHPWKASWYYKRNFWQPSILKGEGSGIWRPFVQGIIWRFGVIISIRRIRHWESAWCLETRLRQLLWRYLLEFSNDSTSSREHRQNSSQCKEILSRNMRSVLHHLLSHLVSSGNAYLHMQIRYTFLTGTPSFLSYCQTSVGIDQGACSFVVTERYGSPAELTGCNEGLGVVQVFWLGTRWSHEVIQRYDTLVYYSNLSCQTVVLSCEVSGNQSSLKKGWWRRKKLSHTVARGLQTYVHVHVHLHVYRLIPDVGLGILVYHLQMD